MSNISGALKSDLANMEKGINAMQSQYYKHEGAFGEYITVRQETGVSCKYCGIIQLSSKELCAYCGAPLHTGCHK